MHATTRLRAALFPEARALARNTVTTANGPNKDIVLGATVILLWFRWAPAETIEAAGEPANKGVCVGVSFVTWTDLEATKLEQDDASYSHIADKARQQMSTLELTA